MFQRSLFDDPCPEITACTCSHLQWVLYCSNWLIGKTGLLLHYSLSRKWLHGSLLKNKGSTWGRGRLAKKKKVQTFPWCYLTMLPIGPLPIGSNFFPLVYRFYGFRIRPPSLQGSLGHAQNNFRLAVAHIFPPQVGNVTVGFNAEDWAIHVINLRISYLKLQENAWMQGHWRFGESVLSLESYYVPKNQTWSRISQDPLSLS